MASRSIETTGGYRQIRGFLDPLVQRDLLHAIQSLRDAAPESRYATKSGALIGVPMTGWGPTTWHSGTEGYGYVALHPVTKCELPPAPALLDHVVREALHAFGVQSSAYDLDAALVNVYSPNQHKLGVHRDEDEHPQRRSSVEASEWYADPLNAVVSISLGEGQARFVCDRAQTLIRPGDVGILSGPSRLAPHGILSVSGGERVNITVRRLHPDVIVRAFERDGLAVPEWVRERTEREKSVRIYGSVPTFRKDSRTPVAFIGFRPTEKMRAAMGDVFVFREEPMAPETLMRMYSNDPNVEVTLPPDVRRDTEVALGALIGETGSKPAAVAFYAPMDGIDAPEATAGRLLHSVAKLTGVPVIPVTSHGATIEQQVVGLLSHWRETPGERPIVGAEIRASIFFDRSDRRRKPIPALSVDDTRGPEHIVRMLDREKIRYCIDLRPSSAMSEAAGILAVAQRCKDDGVLYLHLGDVLSRENGDLASMMERSRAIPWGELESASGVSGAIMRIASADPDTVGIIHAEGDAPIGNTALLVGTLLAQHGVELEHVSADGSKRMLQRHVYGDMLAFSAGKTPGEVLVEGLAEQLQRRLGYECPSRDLSRTTVSFAKERPREVISR